MTQRCYADFSMSQLASGRTEIQTQVIIHLYFSVSIIPQVSEFWGRKAHKLEFKQDKLRSKSPAPPLNICVAFGKLFPLNLNFLICESRTQGSMRMQWDNSCKLNSLVHGKCSINYTHYSCAATGIVLVLTVLPLVLVVVMMVLQWQKWIQ